MAETKNNFFGLIQFVRQKYVYLTRTPLKINIEWFDKLYSTHYTKDLQAKFNKNLFVDQDNGRARELLNGIKLNQDYWATYLKELRILGEWIESFSIEYFELLGLLGSEGIEIDDESPQARQIELLYDRREEIFKAIDTQKAIIDTGIVPSEAKLPVMNNEGLEIAVGFNFDTINDPTEEHRFIATEPSDTYSVIIVFRRLSEIVTQLRLVNNLFPQQFQKVKIIHGNAGMGKSNISAYITTELRDSDYPVIIIKGKSFDGDPDLFDAILMRALNVPDNYTLTEVLDKVNSYGKSFGKRVTIIFDGLNETSTSNDGFSKIWEKHLDRFIEVLSGYEFIYLVATLRTSYITRIWVENDIPYPNFPLRGFTNRNMMNVTVKYLNEYKITYDTIGPEDIFYFKTPLFLDLYCKMLNPDKAFPVTAMFGLNGFKEVFEKYILNLSNSIKLKLALISTVQVKEGMERCSQAMLEELMAHIPILDFYSFMEGKKVDRITGTIGAEVLGEYLIYLKENILDNDVVTHTQQEVGGYLLAKLLIKQHGSVETVLQSNFFLNHIISASGPLHQLKDDILKFLLLESDETSLFYTNYLNHPTVRQYSIITLQTEKSTDKTIAIRAQLDGKITTKTEINQLLQGFETYFFDVQSPINFTFIKDQLLVLDSNESEYTWTKYIYDNIYDINILVNRYLREELSDSKEDAITVEFIIWLLETTLRDLRDKVSIILVRYFEKYPDLIFCKVEEYSKSGRLYIYERLVLICYGVCLRLQNDTGFNLILKDQVDKIYNLQFGSVPNAPTYNYIVIDSLKHIIDLAIYKGIFTLPKASHNTFKNYKFQAEEWLSLNEADYDIVRSISLEWTLSDNPDPLRGDFVHYTISRLEDRNQANRLKNVANIYKRILNLGYKPNNLELSKEEKNFSKGEPLLDYKGKIDRLGKKYSWLAYFDYAGYLLNNGRLDVWQEEDSSFGKHYERLGDVQVEITNPSPVIFNEKIYQIDLFAHQTDIEDWVYRPMYNSLESIYEDRGYTLLQGFINQRQDESYDNRSFLLIESYLVKKDDIQDKIKQITDKSFDWKDDLTQVGTLSKVYFGELYWADTIPNLTPNDKNLPTDDEITIDYRIKPLDPLHFPDKYKREDVGKIINKKVKDHIHFEYEPTIIEYLWESDSKAIPSVSTKVPNTNLGKEMKLKADTKNLQIIDQDNNLAHKTIEYSEDFYSQNYEYLRSDLLLAYMEKNDYLLMYQIKQHTFDRKAGNGTGDFRGMQFLFSSLNR